MPIILERLWEGGIVWAAKVIAGWGQGQLGTEQMDEPRQSGRHGLLPHYHTPSPVPACSWGIARGPSFLCQPPMTRWGGTGRLLHTPRLVTMPLPTTIHDACRHIHTQRRWHSTHPSIHPSQSIGMLSLKPSQNISYYYYHLN